MEAKEKVFSCKRCGRCCHGAATVSVSSEEIEKGAEYLGLTVKEYKLKYCLEKHKRIEMKIVDGHCIFYGEDGLCAIHPVKPFHCRQWPLHPSILADENAWQAIKSDCPGFSEEASYQDVCKLIRGENGY